MRGCKPLLQPSAENLQDNEVRKVKSNLYHLSPEKFVSVEA